MISENDGWIDGKSNKRSPVDHSNFPITLMFERGASSMFNIYEFYWCGNNGEAEIYTDFTSKHTLSISAIFKILEF